MRDIRDEASPYRERYTEFEYWCYAHALDHRSDEYLSLIREGQEDGKEDIFVYVDADGYILPLLEGRQREQASYANYSEEDGVTCLNGFRAYGELPGALREYYFAMQAEALAPYMEPIPAWLAEAPPKAAVVLPGGEAAVLGSLGEGAGVYDMTRDEACGLMVWHRYSADGELLADGQPGDPWLALYFDGYAELQAEIETDERVELYSSGDRLILYRYPEGPRTGEPSVDVLDYHGNRIEISSKEAFQRPPRFYPLAGEMLVLVREAQVRLALEQQPAAN